MKELQIINQQEVLGKSFKVYGDVENPLFLAKDVAEWIDYDKTSINKMLNTVDEDEKLNGTLFLSGQNRKVWFLTEDGLYEVLERSRKSIARELKKEIKKVMEELKSNNNITVANVDISTVNGNYNKVDDEEVMTIDSREVAKMLGKEHKYVLRDIEGTEKVKGIIPTLLSANLHPAKYFIESSYKDVTRKTNKCYLVTKMGCELLGNKQQGEKGILFTAKYVERFNEMEKQTRQQPQLPQTYIEALEQLLATKKEEERVKQQLALQQPKVQIADERLLKNGCYSITEINRSLGLKRGRLTKWAKEHGYIHKTIIEVNEAGRVYFKIYDNGGYKAIGITEEGLKLVQENIEEFK